MEEYRAKSKITESNIIKDDEEVCSKAKSSQAADNRTENKEEKQVYYYMKKHVQYPEKLKNLSDAPSGIYVQGNLPDPSAPAVAIVGARMCSSYGKKQAYEFAKYLAGCGVVIISGLARGIDGYAHEGALDGGGKTYAVLGCGLAHCYPAEHRGLWERIVSKDGGVISEYPACTPPKPWHFPMRNRIISALADLVLVVEAKEKSGSLITADCALEQGKNVYAVPGRVGDRLSLGCNRLISQGAGIAYSPEFLLEELHIDKAKETGKTEKNKFGLASDLDLVYSCLDFEPQNLEEIVRKTGLSIAGVSELLLRLELDGFIEQAGKNNFVKL